MLNQVQYEKSSIRIKSETEIFAFLQIKALNPCSALLCFEKIFFNHLLRLAAQKKNAHFPPFK
jgi:hypothetical protein